MDIPCRQRTFNLGFGVFSIAKFWETVKFSPRISQPTPFPTTFILELFRVAYFRFVEFAQWIFFADNTLSTLDLDFIVEPNFGETVKFSQRISQPTPFPTTFILELSRVAYFRFVELAQWIYFADNTLSTLNLDFIV